MNLFELFVKIGVDDQASGKLKDLGGKLGNGLATAAKIGTAAVGVAAAGITALTTAAVNNYAEYEQLVGGVETLFKGSAGKVQEYAASAFRTAGLSANEYMSTVTSFSASLLQSLGGDTDKAAEYANQALTDMSDNANKMGTDMSLIQNAYQGFAKQNYTMLDNLKLGYGGTKTEMERLVADAAKLDSSIQANDLSFGNIVKAINVVQTEMGITGTTALEAGRTISGSVGAMKSAWSNLVTGFADKNADIEGLINNLVTTIVGDGTESNLGVIGNVLPAIETALGGIAKLIEGAAPKIIKIFPGLVKKIVPSLLSAATDMVKAVIEVLPDLLQTIVTTLVENAPMLITAAIGLVQSLIQGIQDNYQILVDGAINIVKQLVSGILNMLPQILEVGIELLFSLVEGITSMLEDEEFIQSIIDVVLRIIDILTEPDMITQLLNAAVVLIVALAKGLIQALPQLLAKVPEIIGNLVKAFGQFLQPVADVGKNIVEGIKRGISNAWNNLVSWFKGLFGDLIGIAKKILGIASPSKVFKKIGAFTAEGFGAGFEDEFGKVKDDVEDALNFDDASVGINASIRKVGAGAAGGAFGGASIGNININIDGAKYTDEQSLAEAVAQAIQDMTDRRSAVYA